MRGVDARVHVAREAYACPTRHMEARPDSRTSGVRRFDERVAPVTAPNASRVRAGPGVWLFPATYPVHLLEELVVNDGFVRWASRVLGSSMTDREFVGWNIFAFALLCLGAFLVVRDSRLRWVELAIAIALAGNAAGHAVASVVTWTYSPGLVSGLLIWAPLGIVRGAAAFHACGSRGRRAGIAVGVGAFAITLAVLLTTG